VQADIAGLGWRSCFLINVPIGVVALALAARVIPESRVKDAGGLDLVGTAMITAAVTALVLPLVEGRQHGWPSWTWLSLGLAPLLVAGFARRERRLAQRGGMPLLSPALFSARKRRYGLVAQLVFWCGQASFFMVLALYLQAGRGLSALQAGLVFTILAVAYLATSLRAPVLTERHGRRVLAGGALTLACGHGALLAAVAQIGTGGSVMELIPGLVLVGAGMGLGITPLTTIIMAGMRPEDAGATAGALATMQNVGNALGVAVIGVVFFGAVDQGFAYAFELSLAVLAVTLLGVAALARLLPDPAPTRPQTPAGAEVAS
jgi:MFS family permease